MQKSHLEMLADQCFFGRTEFELMRAAKVDGIISADQFNGHNYYFFNASNFRDPNWIEVKRYVKEMGLQELVSCRRILSNIVDLQDLIQTSMNQKSPISRLSFNYGDRAPLDKNNVELCHVRISTWLNVFDAFILVKIRDFLRKVISLPFEEMVNNARGIANLIVKTDSEIRNEFQKQEEMRDVVLVIIDHVHGKLITRYNFAYSKLAATIQAVSDKKTMEGVFFYQLSLF